MIFMTEQTEHYRCVTVVASLNDIEKSHDVFNNVIKAVLKLKNQVYSFNCEEDLIAPSYVAKARSLFVRERTLYNIKDIARSMLAKCNIAVNKGRKTMNIDQIVGLHDPFLCIAPSVTRALFSASLPLHHNYLQHIMERCSFFLIFTKSHVSKETLQSAWCVCWT